MAQAEEELPPESLYRRYIEDEMLNSYRAGGGTDLEQEVRLARLEVVKLLKEGKHEAVGKALLVVAKLVGDHRKATGDQASGIVAGLTQILNEFGLGDGEWDEGSSQGT